MKPVNDSKLQLRIYYNHGNEFYDSRFIHRSKSNRTEHKKQDKIKSETRPETRLPKSRADEQGPYLGRNSEAKEMKS